jgi:hypothetical protein
MKLRIAFYLLMTIPAFSSYLLLAQKSLVKPPFTLVLTSKEPKVGLGNDVWVKIVWTNTSKVELNASSYWDSGSGRDYSYILDFRNGDGDPVAKIPNKSGIPPTFSAGFGTLKPGESRNNEIDLSRIFDLSHPGDYALQVSRRAPKELGGGVIKSNKITITIIPRPVPENKRNPQGSGHIMANDRSGQDFWAVHHRLPCLGQTARALFCQNILSDRPHFEMTACSRVYGPQPNRRVSSGATFPAFPA